MATKKPTRPPRPPRPPRTGSAPPVEPAAEDEFDPRDLPDPLPLPGETRPPRGMVEQLQRDRAQWDAKEGKAVSGESGASGESGVQSPRSAAPDADAAPAAGEQVQIERGRAAALAKHGIDLTNREAVAAEHERRRAAGAEQLEKARARKQRRRAERDAAAMRADVAEAIEGGLDETVARAVAGLAPDDTARRRDLLDTAFDAIAAGERTGQEVLEEVERIEAPRRESRRTGEQEGDKPDGGGGEGSEAQPFAVSPASQPEPDAPTADAEGGEGLEDLKAWLRGEFMDELIEALEQRLVVE